MAITHAEGSSAQLKLMSLQPKTCTRVSDFLPHVIQMEKCSHYWANTCSHIIQCFLRMWTLSGRHHWLENFIQTWSYHALPICYDFTEMISSACLHLFFSSSCKFKTTPKPMLPRHFASKMVCLCCSFLTTHAAQIQALNEKCEKINVMCTNQTVSGMSLWFIVASNLQKIWQI